MRPKYLVSLRKKRFILNCFISLRFSNFYACILFEGFVLFHDRLACLYTGQCGVIEVVLMVCHTTSMAGINKAPFRGFR